jgi:GAF domain-containing protein
MYPLSDLLPADEPARLAALRAYRHLSTLGEPLFEELLALTAKLFTVPVALVSLVEKETVFFAGRVGLSGAERVARQQSLCSVAILHEEATVFEDLEAEPCALVDPFVARANNLRFYAGQALRTPEGHAIGSLCVMDHVARSFTPPEQALLGSLATAVMHLLALRAAMALNPQLAPALWDTIAAKTASSLARIRTLVELGQWEETPNTPEAQAYRASRFEEAALVVQTLNAALRAALV